MLTIAGGIIGVAAGLLLMLGATQPPLRAAAGIVLWIACLFDCADGELARMRREQSLTGMILDGLVDNVVGTAVFLGMTLVMVVSSGQPWLWLLGIFSGLSAAAHVWSYDARKREYLSAIALATPESPSSIAARKRQAWAERRYSDVALLGSYQFFRRTQTLGLSGMDAAPDPGAFRKANYRLMRAWTLMGSSMHLAALYVAAIASAFWPNAMLACALFYAVGLNAIFAWLLSRRWKRA